MKMNFYLAGVPGAPEQTEIKFVCQKRLFSLYELLPFPNGGRLQYIWKKNIFMERAKKKVDLFIDSGAFSAWSQGVTIDIKEYISFIKEYKDAITIYANLDVIGNPEATWKNQKIMERAGLSPLPVFHYNEDPIWLKRYLADGYEYIALGGMVPISNENLSIWLDHLFEEYLTDSEGMPIIKVHGFGLTSLVLMLRYPWHCMTEEDHTIFTKSGWKSLSELSVGEEILAFDKGKSVWQKIENIPIFPVHGIRITHLYNRNFEAFVTENHRWLVSMMNTKDSSYKWKTTNSLLPSDCINRIGKGYNFPKIKTLTDNQVAILAWFWTDGTIKKRLKYKKDNVVIYQSDKRNHEKCEIIRNILINEGESFCECKSKRDDLIQFELYGKLAEWLLHFAPEKRLPDNLPFILTKKQAKLFLDYSIAADGTETKLKRAKGFEIRVSKIIKKNNLDILRNICLLSGITTSEYIDGKYKSLRSSSVKHIYVNKLKKEYIEYSGRIWCIKVKAGAFFTKCKNHIYVTGNSVDSTSWIVTGRMGSIYIPYKKNGKWVYDQNSLKIAVSNRSPNKKEAGKHIETMTSGERKQLIDYITEKGYVLGESKFRKEDQSYQLKENEKWAEKKPVDKNKKREVETILIPGLSNTYQLRDEINIQYFLDLEKAMPTWPWAFKHKSTKRLF